MPKFKLLFLVILLLAISWSLSSQQLIAPVAGVVTVDTAPAKAPYEVFVNATITSVVFTNQTPGQLITVLFLQDSTGHSVTFGGNILNACSVSQTANALTSCQFQYDARTVQWTGLGGGGGTPGGSNTQVQFNNNGAFGGGAGFVVTNAGSTATSVTINGTDNTGTLQVGVGIGAFGGATGGKVILGGNSLVAGFALTNTQPAIGGTAGYLSLPNGLISPAIQTTTNCSSSASPAVCGAAASGSVVVAAAATTVQVNTTAVSANSQIQLTFDSSLGTKLSVTCNTTPVQPTVSARTAASNFTITVPTAPTTNPACFSYTIVN